LAQREGHYVLRDSFANGYETADEACRKEESTGQGTRQTLPARKGLWKTFERMEDRRGRGGTNGEALDRESRVFRDQKRDRLKTRKFHQLGKGRGKATYQPPAER